jgi:signal transduction histidine kinase
MRTVTASRLAYAPLLLGITLIGAMFLVAESGHSRLRDATAVVAASQQRQMQLSSYMQLLLEGESAQRGFLLTEDTRYLRQFDPAVRRIDPLLDEIVRDYREAGLAAEAARIDRLRQLTGVKVGDMLASLRLYGEQDLAAALALVNTDIGEKTMAELRDQLRRLHDIEGDRLQTAAAAWRSDLRASRLVLTAATALSLVLVVLAGMQFARDLRRRERERLALDGRNRELDRLVRERTGMLFNLSSRLQEVAEREKAALARELHDELGGLLVATKIDVSWLRRRCGEQDENAALRWDRVLRCLDDGLDVKRRVIESLRPTLLDNVGLVAALRWLVDESVRRNGIECRERYDEPLPQLTPDARIAVFRVVQEGLMNVIKHAEARSIDVTVSAGERELTVVIRDDGIGIDEERLSTLQTHGLLGMRHRIEALGGRLNIRSLGPGRGTEFEFSLPWDRIRGEVRRG